MDLRSALEATFAAKTASTRELDDGEVHAEGEVRFDGPAARMTTTDGEQLMRLEGELWSYDEDGWARWQLGVAPRHNDDAFGTFQMLAALEHVTEVAPKQYRGTSPGRSRPEGGPVTVELDDEGRVIRVAYRFGSSERTIEFFDFGRDVELQAPEEWEWFYPMGKPVRPTRFAGRNSAVRRRRRRARRR